MRLRRQKIRNLGGKLGASIAEAYEAVSVRDLLYDFNLFPDVRKLTAVTRSVSVAELQRKMGEESGMWVWEMVRGLDFSDGKLLKNL